MVDRTEVDPRKEALAVVAKTNRVVAQLEERVKPKLALLDTIARWFQDNQVTGWTFSLVRSPVEFYVLRYDDAAQCWFIRRRISAIAAYRDLHAKNHTERQAESHRVNTVEGMECVRRAPLNQLVADMVKVGRDEGHSFSERDLALYQNYSVVDANVDAPVNADLR